MKAFVDEPDLNNIGLLVSTTGKVTHTDTGYFYLDDGSKLYNGSGCTGVSSCYKRDGNLFRIIRATQITPVP